MVEWLPFKQAVVFMNKVISVFFSGTDHDIDNDPNELASVLARLIDTSPNQLLMGFSGCGVEFGRRGAIFGTGLDEQCQQVITVVESEIMQGHKVTLNVFGFSRGAIAALLLAKQLGEISRSLLEINLALLDPVPGNLITTAQLDILNITLANKTMDLTDANSVKDVLTLYPHKPLRTLAVHAPLMTKYSPGTHLTEEVVPGCHANAQRQDIAIVDGLPQFTFNPKGNFVTFANVFSFMKKHGSRFKKIGKVTIPDMPEFAGSLDDESALLDVYGSLNEIAETPSSRACHSGTGRYITTKTTARYYNRQHYLLANPGADINCGGCQDCYEHSGYDKVLRLSIQENKGITAILNEISPAWIVKILLSALIIAGLVALIPALPFGMPLLAGIAVGIFIFTLPLALAMVFIESILEWCVGQFCYPQFAIRYVDPEKITPSALAGLSLKGDYTGEVGYELPVLNSNQQPPSSSARFFNKNGAQTPAGAEETDSTMTAQARS